ncbi:MAG: hypothetical protein ACR2PL_18730 [Dehalococcoidia bacterium]
MPTIAIELTAEEESQLHETASNREMTVEALVHRWVRERLVHERERAAGGGKALSPRARREQDQASQ